MDIKQTLGHHKRTLAAERIELPAYAGRVVGRRINAEGHWDDYNHDLPHIQRFEVNNDPQKTNTISTVEKDNMIAVHVDGTSKQYPVYEVSGGFITYNGVSYEIALPDGYYIIRYHLIKQPGGGSTVYGWVNAADVQAVGNGTTAPKMRVGAKVKYSGPLYRDSNGGGQGKTVNGTYTVKYYYPGRKCGVHIDGLGWVPESGCTVIG